jgi:hypothetical protein
MRNETPARRDFLMFLARRVLVFFTCVIVVFAFVHIVAGATEGEARSAINSAQQQLITCYQAFADADKAGASNANATELMRLQNVLNNASVFLSKADLAFQNGNYTGAGNYASLCQQGLTGFVDAANSLKQSAENHAYWDFMVNVVGSSVGAVAVIVAGFLVWVFLKRKYPSVGGVVQ